MINRYLVFLFLIGTVVVLLEAKKSKVNDKCGTCQSMVNKFSNGLEKTKNSIHFKGGNKEGWTKDKEKYLGKYELNEARLVEIMEDICGHDQNCFALLEDAEEYIESWWAGAKFSPDAEQLRTKLCITDLKACCQVGHFGPKCTECPGGAVNPCSGKGFCDGEKSRSGTGKCNCQVGYTGEACEACTTGYSLTESGQCVDIDECTEPLLRCGLGEYCSNSPGHFICNPCDPLCAPETGCTGPSSSFCVACIAGYEKNGTTGICSEVNECLRFPCAHAEDCSNTVGSYTCACNPPNYIEEGSCQAPQAIQDALRSFPALQPGATGASVLQQGVPSNDTEPREFVYRGKSTIGDSITRVKLLEVVFPQGIFLTIPHVGGLQVTNECCGDSFALHAANITTNGFVMVVSRMAVQSGWGQLLDVEWSAWADRTDAVNDKPRVHMDEL